MMDTPEAIAASYLQRRTSIDISNALSRGWALVRDHMAVLVGATVLGWLITVGLAFVPILGWIVGFVLLGGLDYMFLRRIRGEDVLIGRPLRRLQPGAPQFDDGRSREVAAHHASG